MSIPFTTPTWTDDAPKKPLTIADLVAATEKIKEINRRYEERVPEVLRRNMDPFGGGLRLNCEVMRYIHKTCGDAAVDHIAKIRNQHVLEKGGEAEMSISKVEIAFNPAISDAAGSAIASGLQSLISKCAALFVLLAL